MTARGASQWRQSARAADRRYTGYAPEATSKDINKHHRNSRYLGNDVVLSNTLRATTGFAEAAHCTDVVVMGVPSRGF